MIDPSLPDALDDFLEQPPHLAEPAGLRDRVLALTQPILRRRRMMRRSLWAAGALAASVLLFALWSWKHPQSTIPQENPAPLPIVAQKLAPTEPRVEEKESESPPMPLAVALEWKAFDATEKERAKLYVLAGNRYLDLHQDIASALRCYRQALEAADASMQEVQPDDTWLLTALKLDRH